MLTDCRAYEDLYYLVKKYGEEVSNRSSALNQLTEPQGKLEGE